MSSVIEFLKSINLDVNVSTRSYVYYTPADGKIHKISSNRHADERYEILEVAHDEVVELINGRRRTDEFIVTYDVSLKQLALKEITYEAGLDSIETVMHRLPVFRTTTTDIGEKRSIIFENIYDGVEVLVWVQDEDYSKNSTIWFNNNVYVALEDLPAADTLDLNKVRLFVEDVRITDVKSSNHFLEYKTKFVPIFENVHVDVWYNELPHLAGQHVWIYNNVYKIKETQQQNTRFDTNNAELVESNVVLYNDRNKELDFVTKLSPGAKILDNNQLYLFLDEKITVEMSKKNKSIMFYTSKFDALCLNEETNKFVKFSLNERNNQMIAELDAVNDELPLMDTDHIRRGQKVLIGKTLYLAKPLDEHDYDINVVQNNLLGCWEIYLGKRTKKALETLGYNGSDTMYFSITAKHDPNILYKTIEFSLKALISDHIQKYPYQHEWEFNKEDVSVYTSKYFDSYAHEIVE